jgi:hypothetical protein
MRNSEIDTRSSSSHQLEATMTNPDSTEQEDPRLQVDPVLTLSGGRATFGQKLFGGIAAIIVLLGTLYGLLHSRSEMSRSTAIFAISGAVLPETVGQTK